MGSIESTICGGEGTCICARPRASANEVRWLAGSARGQRESSRAGRSGRQSERRRTLRTVQTHLKNTRGVDVDYFAMDPLSESTFYAEIEPCVEEIEAVAGRSCGAYPDATYVVSFWWVAQYAQGLNNRGKSSRRKGRGKRRKR